MEFPSSVLMDPIEVEGLAADFYRRLGMASDAPQDTFTLARALLGPDAIVKGARVIGARATTFTVHGRRRIAPNAKLTYEVQQHAVGHELGHIVFDELGYKETDIEAMCDLFGAAVMAPLPAVRALLRTFGRDHEAIAEEVGGTQTWAALRVAEYLRIPRAVVTPARTYVRGPDEFVWGPEEAVRRLARARQPGVRKVRLTDDPSRVLIDVDEVEAETG